MEQRLASFVRGYHDPIGVMVLDKELILCGIYVKMVVENKMETCQAQLSLTGCSGAACPALYMD